METLSACYLVGLMEYRSVDSLVYPMVCKWVGQMVMRMEMLMVDKKADKRAA